MPLNFIQTSKGKLKLFYSGHFFYQEKAYNGKTHWKCANYLHTRCPARLTTSNGELEKIGKNHNHVADAADAEAKVLMDRIIDDAKSTNDSPHAILTSALEGFSQASATRLPLPDSMKRMIRRVRQKNSKGPALPLCREDIVFPEEYKTTVKGDPFLLYDSGSDVNRMIIYSTRDNLRCLARADHWYVDGTFKTVPLLFYQLYTIHGLKGNNSIPLVYALLPNKTEATYIKLLKELKILEPSACPATITMDYERAMLNACTAEFPSARLRGCFFHFAQCIWRSLQTNGLMQRYEQDSEFALQMRMIPALAFVPPSRITSAFELLSDAFPQEAQSVLHYFEDNWVGRPNHRGRYNPPFPHELWNQFDSVLEDLPRTNNAVEGWHRAFELQVAAHHPNIWRFIDCLKKEQNFNEFKIEQLIAGCIPKRKKRYVDLDGRIKNIVEGFDDSTDILQHLRGIAHNLSF